MRTCASLHPEFVTFGGAPEPRKNLERCTGKLCTLRTLRTEPTEDLLLGLTSSRFKVTRGGGTTIGCRAGSPSRRTRLATCGATANGIAAWVISGSGR